MRVSFLVLLCALLVAAPPPAASQTAGDRVFSDFEAASAALKRGDYDTAIALLTRVIASGRMTRLNLAAAYSNRCLAYTQKQQYALGKSDCDRALEITPSDHKTLLARGIVLAGLKQNDAALADFDRAIAFLSASNDPRGRSLLAETLLRRGTTLAVKGQFAEASADIARVIALAPSARAHALRALIRERSRDYAGAIADFDSAIALEPRDAASYRSRARLKQRTCGQECALADYSKAIELDPRDADSYRNRAFIHREAGHWSAAAADYGKLIELQPGGIDGYFGRGGAYLRLDQLDRAVADLEKGAALKPDDAGTFSYRASTYFLAGYYDRAVEDYSRAIRMKPSQTTYYEARAWANIRRGRHDDALADTDRALQLDPKSEFAILYRAVAHAGLGRNAEALADFERAREMPKVATLAMAYRGDYMAALGRYQEAIADYTLAVRRSPAWQTVYNARGVARLLGGDAAGAVADLQRAADLWPRDAFFAVNLYLARERSGQKGWADLARGAGSLDLIAWPGPLVSFALGNLDATRLLAAADHADPGVKRNRSCVAHFVVGAVAFNKGDKGRAAEHLRQSAGLCGKGSPYGVWADGDLKQIK